MNYPNQLTALNNGLSLYIPNKELVKHTYDELLKNDSNTPFPFWAKIWASSIALCDFLKAHPNWVQEKKVLEKEELIPYVEQTARVLDPTLNDFSIKYLKDLPEIFSKKSNECWFEDDCLMIKHDLIKDKSKEELIELFG